VARCSRPATARDLAAWIVTLIENSTVGVFNALGPTNHPEVALTVRRMLDACNQAAGNLAKLVWVPTEFLDKHDVAPWSEMPGWIEAEGDHAGFGALSNKRAVAAGLIFRPVLETAKDTLAWLASPEVEEWVTGAEPFGSASMRMLADLPEDKRQVVRGSGISRDKEAKVLAAWKAKS